MKLRKLSSNFSDVFPDIDFTDGLNVVFARVQNPSHVETDSHNLGKTFLTRVIDFVLLGSIDKSHEFRKHADILGLFVLIRRPVSGRSNIQIASYKSRSNNVEFQHEKLGLDKARATLDGLLSLTAISSLGYAYRKGLTYSLRRQADYHDEFRLSRFSIGKDRDWKPYVAGLLGLDHEKISRKYELEDEIQRIESEIKHIEASADIHGDEYDEVSGTLQLRKSRARELEEQIGRFSFRDLESGISEELVNSVEAQISDLNEELYDLDYRLKEISDAVKEKPQFDLDNVRALHAEIGLYFPDNLTRSYEELVEFNDKITSERRTRLTETRSHLVSRRGEIQESLSTLDRRRTELLGVLNANESFDKYKLMQSELLRIEAEVIGLESQLASLDRAAPLREKQQECEGEIREIVAALRKMERQPGDMFNRIREKFSEYVDDIVNAQSLLSFSINASGNIDFSINMLDVLRSKETSESSGTSYKKILCAAFDMTLLSIYSEQSYYRFVYHDGIFEGLDNRRKVDLLNTVRKLCREHGIQYVLTVIDTDLPRDLTDEKLLFDESEIIRELHDEGQDGRLFRTKGF